MKSLSKSSLTARYYAARSQSDKWMSMLQQSYDYAMPNDAQFGIWRQIQGAPRTNKVFDATAIIGLKKFAANIQQMLLPNSTYWAKFKPGYKVLQPNSGVDARQAQIECDEWQETFFRALDKSNFSNAVYQSIMEMGISTGVLLIQPGTREDPFKFKSVPLHQVALEAGPHDSVDGVFRRYRMRARTILETWPKGNFTQSQVEILSDGSNDEMELVEGSVYEPDLKGNKKYCFFVYMEGQDDFIVKEYINFSPWVVFRWDLYADEIFGRGPIVDLLPFIKVLNQLAQYDLQAASFNSNPIFMVNTGSEINPFSARISPGAIIPVQQNTPGVFPIQQLQIQGQPTYSQLTRVEMVTALNEALNTSPIVPNNDSQKTATEVNTRRAEWLRQNQSMAGRLEKELCRQVVDKCWMILHSFGMVPIPRINDEELRVEFESQIKDMQGQQEVQKAIEATKAMEAIGGPQVGQTAPAMGYQIEDMPSWVCDKLNVDPKIVRSELSKRAVMKQMAKDAQAQQSQQDAAQAQAGQIQKQAQEAVQE